MVTGSISGGIHGVGVSGVGVYGVCVCVGMFCGGGDGVRLVDVFPMVASLIGAGPLVAVDIWHPDTVKHIHSAVTIATFLIPRFSHMGADDTGATGGLPVFDSHLGGRDQYLRGRSPKSAPEIQTPLPSIEPVERISNGS